MAQLILQLGLGLVIIACASGVQAVVMGLGMRRKHLAAQRFQDMTALSTIWLMAVASTWVLLGIVASVVIWAVALLWVGAFDKFEMSVYFALASYTTLGFGDVLTPTEWRILGAMIGANGMLGFGLATAAMIEFLRDGR